MEEIGSAPGLAPHRISPVIPLTICELVKVSGRAPYEVVLPTKTVKCNEPVDLLKLGNRPTALRSM